MATGGKAKKQQAKTDDIVDISRSSSSDDLLLKVQDDDNIIKLSQSLIPLLLPSFMKAMEDYFDNKHDQMIGKLDQVISTNLDLQNNIAKLEVEVKDLRDDRKVLIKRISDLEDYNRRENLIINGLGVNSFSAAVSGRSHIEVQDIFDGSGNSQVGSHPANSVTEGMILDTVLNFFNDTMGLNVKPEDISTTHYLKWGRGDTSRAIQGQPILVRFTKRRIRNLVYSSRLRLKNQDRAQRIFINEHLSPSKAEIFKKTREAVKEKRIATTWTNNGVILYKKEKTREARVFVVNSVNDIP